MPKSDNLRKGDKAEYLSQVYLTSIAFSNPTYRQEDYGIDFSCTLIDEEGVNLFPTDAFLVQVKTNKDPKEQHVTFTRKDEKDLIWLYRNQIPFFIAWLDMENTKKMYFYSISPVWYHEVMKNRMYKALVFEYDTKETSEVSSNGFKHYKHDNDTYYFKLGKPFMSFGLDDIKDDNIIGSKRAIIKKMIDHERSNILYRNLKLPVLQWLHEYIMNDIDSLKFAWAHFCSPEEKSINNPQEILTHMGQLLITLAKSYELHSDDKENGEKYKTHFNNLSQIIQDLPDKKVIVEGNEYNYKPYLENLGFKLDDKKEQEK